jgi:hypothetical protein
MAYAAAQKWLKIDTSGSRIMLLADGMTQERIIGADAGSAFGP